MDTFTKELCKAARALAGLTANELSDLAGVAQDTLRSFESGRTKSLNRENERSIVAALESKGVRVLSAGETVAGSGVAFNAKA